MKKTWILIAVTVLVCGYAFFDFQTEEKEKKAKDEASVLFPMKKDQVQEIRVENDKEKFTLQRSVQGWSLIDPLQDEGDNDSIEAFAGVLTEEKSTDIAKEGEGIDFKSYGFGPESTFISMKSSDGQSHRLEISPQKNFESNSFVRRDNENKILIAAPTWSGHATRTISDFRNKKFLRKPIAEIQEFEIKNANGAFSLVLKDSQWKASAHPQLALDQNRVRDLLGTLADWKASEIVANDLKTKSKFSLDKKTVQIRLKIKDQDWTAELAHPNDKDYYGSNSQPGYVYKLDKDGFEKMAFATLSSLRERKAPFQFDPAPVKKLQIHTALKKNDFQREENTWQLTPPNPDSEVRQDQIKDLLDRLKAAEVSDYTSADAAKSFKPENRIHLKDEKDQTVFELMWSRLERRKVNGVEKSEYLAKTSQSPEVFLLEEAEVQKLTSLELVQKKKPVSETVNPLPPPEVRQ